MPNRHNDDDDPFDERGILKDGRAVRVSMMDAMSAREHQRHCLVTDAQGGTRGLHKPGYRVTANSTRDHSHYDAYDAMQRDAYKGDAVGEGREGAICTVQNAEFPDDFGSPGHIRMFKGKLVCCPDKPVSADAMTTDARASAYSTYDQQLRESWRSK